MAMHLRRLVSHAVTTTVRSSAPWRESTASVSPVRLSAADVSAQFLHSAAAPARTAAFAGCYSFVGAHARMSTSNACVAAQVSPRRISSLQRHGVNLSVSMHRLMSSRGSSSSKGGKVAPKHTSHTTTTFASSVEGRNASTASTAAALRDAEKAAWQLYWTHENAYLNWLRNGLTATALGMAFVMFRVTSESADFSLGGTCIQAMGGTYVVVGCAQYLLSAVRLRHQLCITPLGWVWYIANSLWPVTLYSTGMRCLYDMHPRWFLELVAANVDSLPMAWQGRCMEIVAESQMRDFKGGKNKL